MVGCPVGVWLEFAGDNHSLELFGVRLVGVNAENGMKVLFSIGFIMALMLLRKLLLMLGHLLVRGWDNKRVAFWMRQGVQLTIAAILLIGLLSIWFNDPTRLATVLGLVSAGLAFALQRVITALAGYFVILRGKTFNVGDRIMMGGVRGDVIALGFLQTTIMEMGQPPRAQNDPPAMWVAARQYTGRIVTVTNAKVFDEPVYNYTREFPYIWEEMTIPVTYTADRKRAEQILLEAARRHTTQVEGLSEEALQELERRYVMKRAEMGPRVYFRLTDNWLELTVRFITEEHGIRDVKDAMSREIIGALDEAKIGIASGTYDIVGLPPVKVELTGDGRGAVRPEVRNPREAGGEHSPQPGQPGERREVERSGP